MTRYFPPQVTLRALLLLLLIALLPVPTVADPNSPPIKVATTIGMVADLVKQVGGERVVVDTLMGPGVDPHLYKPTAHDASRLASADVIFYSGLMLEGRMGDLFERLSSAGKKTYATSDSVDRSLLQQPAQFQGHYDPHIWFDVSMWAQTVPTIVKGLSEADPASKATFEKNGAALQAKLKEIHEWCRKKAEELPREKRILVTSHDAYNYFGRAYGFKVVGLQGVSTVSEAGLADMTALVDLIQKEKVKAIFVESSVNPAAIRRVAKDAGVSVGGELFSDAMGAPGAMREGFDTGTYEGMVKHNLTIIVEALR
ncbi:zinc ABC transporter substrate-binding protein [Candidatus Sumerlaeota bacterium]|nr:zinc ABC transporter substrate-binding protein [Candidatus Sumerlaeota bacterium]